MPSLRHKPVRDLVGERDEFLRVLTALPTEREPGVAARRFTSGKKYKNLQRFLDAIVTAALSQETATEAARDPKLTVDHITTLDSLGLTGCLRWTRPLLHHVSNKTDAHILSSLMYALGMLGDARAVPKLLSVAASTEIDPGVRGHAIEAVAFCTPAKKHTVRCLRRALNDPSEQVRFFAAYSLGNCGDETALEDLARVLSDEAECAGMGTVASEAEWAIGEIRRRASDRVSAKFHGIR
jgi:HEAT repeat protein